MIDREHPTWRLADRFVVETRLGQGAMGEVFRAYDEHQQRTVALKVLKPERSQSGRLQRFKREFRAAARLEHPYCVRSHELVEREGLAMLVMDYVPGGALVLRRFEHVADVVRLALQLLAGLDHIHGKRLVHRDLKPSNILVERPLAGPLHPRLCDFGITDVVELSHDDAAVGLVQGSLSYLAPETLESGVADPRSDLYSLGLVLYGLLIGEHPFGGRDRSLREWLTVHRRGHVPSLTQLRPDAPPGLVEVVHQLCNRRPQDRFEDAAAAYDALLGQWEQWPEAGPLPPIPPLLRRPYLAAPAFSGRASELEELQQLHADCRQGRGPRSIQVVGDAGQGKSRLLRELLLGVLDTDTMVFPATCRAESSAPYEPLRGLLAALDEVSLDGDETPVAAAVRERAPADPTTSTLGGNETPTSLAHELRPPIAEPEDATSGRLQAHTRWSTRLQLLGRRRPVLLLLEDAQWADPPTLQLLTTLVRTLGVARAKGEPVRFALVVSHRRSADNPDLDLLLAGLADQGTLAKIDLQPLSPLTAVEVLASMLMMSVRELPPGFWQPLVSQADGNPLFLTQMLYILLGRGQLQRGPDGRWQLGTCDLGAARLPRSVNKAVGEQAARLATDHKRILVAAAVLGRRFEVRPLAAVTELDELALLDGLDELVRTELIEDHEHGYRFRHDRIREAILEAAPMAERRRLHARAAEDLVEHDDELPSAWPTIAYHFEHADDDDALAIEYALRSARRASREHAYGAALEGYRTALRLAERSGLVLDDELWERQGDAHMALGHYHDAVEAYSRRLTTLRAPTERAWLSSKVGFVEFKQGNFSRAIEVLEGVLGSLGARLPWLAASLRLWIVLSIVRSLLPPRRWRGSLEAVKVAIRTHVLLAECYHMNMVPVRAAYHSATAAYLARRLGASTDSVRALSINGLGLLLYGQRRIGLRQLAQARAYMQAVAVPESVRCRLEVSAALGSLAQGEVGRALEQLEDAWRRFGAAASAEARVYVLSMLTYLLIATGHDPRRCEHYIRRMLALAEELHDDRTLAVAYVHRGYMLACAGRFLDAIEPLRRGQRLAHKVGDHANELRASDLLTIALTIENGIDEALERGRAAARRSLTALGSHSYMSRDAGLLVVATELVRRGRPLTKEDDALVRRLLRRRRKGAVALPSGATLFRVAEAAWHAAHGRAHTGAASAIAHAGRLGLDGEASLGRHVALYLEGKKPAWTLHSESTAFAPAHEPMAPPVAR